MFHSLFKHPPCCFSQRCIPSFSCAQHAIPKNPHTVHPTHPAPTTPDHILLCSCSHKCHSFHACHPLLLSLRGLKNHTFPTLLKPASLLVLQKGQPDSCLDPKIRLSLTFWHAMPVHEMFNRMPKKEMITSATTIDEYNQKI